MATLQRLINNMRQGFNSLVVDDIKVKDGYLLGCRSVAPIAHTIQLHFALAAETDRKTDTQPVSEQTEISISTHTSISWGVPCPSTNVIISYISTIEDRPLKSMHPSTTTAVVLVSCLLSAIVNQWKTIDGRRSPITDRCHHRSHS